jgi:heat shock protein HslJ
MLHLRVLLFGIFVAYISSACSSPVTSPTSMAASSSSAYTSAQLEGSWIVSAIQPAGGSKQDRPTGATYTLTFADGRFSTRADCNTCAGSFTVDGTNLTTSSNLACTRAACPTMSFESAYTSLLSGNSQAVVANSTLTLSSSRGTIWLVRQD